MANRMVDAARGVLNQFLSDVYIYTDHAGPARTGKYVIVFSFSVVQFSMLCVCVLLMYMVIEL